MTLVQQKRAENTFIICGSEWLREKDGSWEAFPTPPPDWLLPRRPMFLLLLYTALVFITAQLTTSPATDAWHRAGAQ